MLEQTIAIPYLEPPAMEENKKPWYLSKTIVAGAVQVAAGVGMAAGYLTTEDAETVTSTGPAVITGLLGAVAGAVAIYGRVKADKKVDL